MAKTTSSTRAPEGPDLTAIVRILERTHAHLGLESLCRSLTRAILKEISGPSHASLWAFGPNPASLFPLAISIRTRSRIETQHTGKRWATSRPSALFRIRRTGKACLTNDTRRKPALITLADTPCGSELCLPVKNGDQVSALLIIQGLHAGAFSHGHLQMLQILAQHVGKALRNSWTHENLKGVNQRLIALQSLGSAISASLDLQEILDATIMRLPQIMGLRLCSIFLYNAITSGLELKAHNHPDLGDRKISIKQSEDRIINRIFGLSRSRWIRDVEKEFHRRNRRKYTSKSSLNLLLKAGDKLVGVLNLNDKLDGSNFTREDFNLSDLFANQLALSINTSRLYDRTLQMALHDGLTGLYVHRHFQETLDRETARSERTRSTFSLILADIDHFKNVNDRFGHQCGDTALRGLAGIFQRMVRQIDYVCRYGGEEFAFILPDTSIARAKVLVSRIHHAVNRTRFRLQGKICRLSVSFGIAENDGSLGKEELLRRADLALYAAKRQGRNRIVLFES